MAYYDVDIGIIGGKICEKNGKSGRGGIRIERAVVQALAQAPMFPSLAFSAEANKEDIRLRNFFPEKVSIPAKQINNSMFVFRYIYIYI